MNVFVGRQNELEGLKGLFGKKSASLIVIKGRRRIGKTRLAEEFGREFTHVYLFSGLPPTQGMQSKHQKQEFQRKLKGYKIPRLGGDDWGDLFTDLANHCRRGRRLIILDEISWMGMQDPSFLGKLKTVWDEQFKKNPHLMIIISGSQSTWIEKNIIGSSGFVGRISYQLTLDELSLSECNQFWGTSQKHISSYEKLKLLSITGGVPRYLEEIQPSLTAEENIKRLCFQPEGFLFNEFEQIFSDLFSKRSEKYKVIVQSLAHGNTTTEDIAKALGRDAKGRSKGGDISEYLQDLCLTGFITRDYTWDLKRAKTSKLSRYRLSDNYLHFYLKYIEPNRDRILNHSMSRLPNAWLSILGLQFENLVLSRKNRIKIYELLGIPLDEIVWSNPFFQTRTTQRSGCQIDFLIQTKFHSLYLCEIKFSKKELEKNIIQEVQQKIEKLKMPRHFSIRPILIHVNDVSDGVIESDFFAKIINFSQLLD